MRNFSPALYKSACLVLLLYSSIVGKSQTTQPLKLTDFAVWGGSASSNSYNTTQGVFIGNTVGIQGNIGSIHRVDVKNIFNITGNVYSGNIITIGNLGKITGNIFAAKAASNYTGSVITSDYKIEFNGNITANG